MHKLQFETKVLGIHSDWIIKGPNQYIPDILVLIRNAYEELVGMHLLTPLLSHYITQIT